MAETATPRPLHLEKSSTRYHMISAGGHCLRVQWQKPDNVNSFTLIFLHEGLGSITQWKDIPTVLGETTGFGTLNYDRFGYGGSAPLTTPYNRPIDSMQIEARDTIPDLLDNFDIKRAVLFGHSDGGTIALLAAAAGDQRIKGVIAEAAHLFVEGESLNSIRSVHNEWATGDLRKRLERHHGDNVDGAFFGWANLWLDPAFASFNICEELGRITCPVLAIQGTKDMYGTLRQIDAIKKSIPEGVETLILPDCGHIPHLEQRDIVVKRIITFLRARIQC